jgi:hypothetical protein
MNGQTRITEIGECLYSGTEGVLFLKLKPYSLLPQLFVTRGHT